MLRMAGACTMARRLAAPPAVVVSSRAAARRVGGGSTSAPPAPAAMTSTARGGGPAVVGAQGARVGSSSMWRKRYTTAAIPVSSHGAGQVKPHIHANGVKTLLQSEALHKYMLNTMVYPREHERLRELRLISEQHVYGYMTSPPDSLPLLAMLLKLTGARNTIEVGVFTGYSVLATALALPDDGKVVAVDVSREFYDVGRPSIERAGVAHKVDFREGPASEHLDALLADEANHGAFDFAFVDADKGSYGGYHERLLRLVRVGGVLAYDNTLWFGTVAQPDDAPLTDGDREVREQIRAFNDMVAADARVEAVLLPVADGITLCRRIV